MSENEAVQMVLEEAKKKNVSQIKAMEMLVQSLELLKKHSERFPIMMVRAMEAMPSDEIQQKAMVLVALVDDIKRLTGKELLPIIKELDGKIQSEKKSETKVSDKVDDVLKNLDNEIGNK